MNSEEPYRDQAERLRRRIEQINEQTEYKDVDNDNDKVNDKDLYPPREQLHRQKKKKTKFKLKYPVIRLLVLFFILLPIIIFSVISYLDGKNGPVKTSGDSKNFDTINLENPKHDKENKIDVKQDQEDPKQQTNESDDPKDDSTTQKQEPSSKEEKQISTETEAVSSNNQGTAKSEPSTKTEKPGDSAAQSKTLIYHTVQPEETLFRIAMKYFHSPEGMVIIQKANHLSSDQIEAGKVLKIPIEK